ncbi:MAG: hypothetical protein HUU01_06160 [Saprospiraceae bacterium]|nr:hypothetical protein [Saprospiraceae bacterium]
MSAGNTNNDIVKVISKGRPEHISLDFERLRSEGIRHLENLATEIWTDFNAHDPGITILEVLCYAITDLAYRTRILPIADIASSGGSGKPWFEAAEILPVSPVTAKDFRKILIDLDGIRNAWIERAKPSDAGIKKLNESIEYLHKKPVFKLKCLDDNNNWDIEAINALASKFVAPKNAEGEDNPDHKVIVETITNVEIAGGEQDLIKTIDKIKTKLKSELKPREGNPLIDPEAIVKEIICTQGYFEFSTTTESTYALGFSGIYRIWLEVDDDIDPKSTKQTEKIIRRAMRRLQENRSLGHDFLEPEVIQNWKFCLCIDIETEPAANEKMIAAEILHRIQEFLVPTIRFYNFAEMRAKGYASDQIFNGPLLNHGFIDDREMERATLPQYVFHSDLMRIAMETPGVLDVHELSIKGPGTNGKYVQDWKVEIRDSELPNAEEPLKPLLDACCSKVQVHRGDLTSVFYGDALEEEYNGLRLAAQGLSFDQPGGPVFEGGSYRPDLGDYESIQYDFPGNYMIGSHRPHPGRIYATRQTQAYLLFFDQILSSYLSQLGRVKKLFAVQQNPEEPTQILPALFDAPGALELMGDFAELTFPLAAYAGVKHLAEEKEQLLLAQNEQLNVEITNTDDEVLQEALKQQIIQNQSLIATWKAMLAEMKKLENKPFAGITQLRKTVSEKAGNLYAEIAALVDKNVWEHYAALANNNIIRSLEIIGDPPAQRQDRRNKLLDHLIARFGESFSEYVASLLRADSNPEDNPWRQDFAEYLQDKARFLENIPIVGAERGRGLNYRKFREDKGPDVWNTTNVSGLQKRVSALLGMDAGRQQSLLGKLPYYFDITAKQPAQGRRLYQINLRRQKDDLTKKENPARRGPLMSSRDIKSLEVAEKIVKFLYQNIWKTDKLKPRHIPNDESYSQVFFEGEIPGEKDLFELFSRTVPNKEVLALHEELKALLSPRTTNDREGFHIIEHILLRPNDDRDQLLKLLPGCDFYETPKDPYSFWATIVLPDWVGRFQYPDFRNLVEHTFRREAPAYMALHFCWVNREAMYDFEPKFKNWLEEKAKCTSDECRVTEAANLLIEWLNVHLAPCICPDETPEKSICE